MSDLTLPIVGLTTLFGYFFGKEGKTPRENETVRNVVSNTEIPNGKNIYTSDVVNEANGEVLRRSTHNYKQSENPAETGVLPPLFNTYSNSMPIGQAKPVISGVTSAEQARLNDIYKLVDPTQMGIRQRPVSKLPMFGTMENLTGIGAGDGAAAEGASLLTGQRMDASHNNMVPFFGSNVKQNVEGFANQTILDLHTGNTSTYRKKREVERFFNTQPENIYGSPALTTEIDTDRYIQSQFRQNEKPFQEEHIAAPKAGTFDNAIRPTFKTVNELRTWDKLKQTYEGRTLAGKMGDVRGVQNDVNKNRPDTFYEKTEDHLFKTTGEFIAPKVQEDFSTNFKHTARNDYTTDYYGNVGKEVPSTQRRLRLETERVADDETLAQLPKRLNFENDYGRNVSGVKSSVDYGKSAIRAHDTERTTTGVETHTLNVGDRNRGVRTRFDDIAKITVKETTLSFDNSGNVNTAFNRGIRDTADVGISEYVPRTTQKETAALNNYTGVVNKESGKGYIVNKYDARTTNKESISANSEYTGNGERLFKNASGAVSHGKIKTTFNMILKEEEDVRDREFNNSYSQRIPGKVMVGTKTKLRSDKQDISDRLDESLVKSQLENNPLSMYFK
jgi:hypothetical protein